MTTTSTPTLKDRRRQHTRVPLRMSAEVHVGDTSFTATTRDLSEGGCGLELKQLLTEGVEVTLGLFLVVDDVEDERMPPLWVKGRVAWVGELDDGRFMAGVRFEVITDQQKAWVGQVLGHLTLASPAR
jgi:c-di-GMP-binding flagellar brake protein YcgR